MPQCFTKSLWYSAAEKFLYSGELLQVAKGCLRAVEKVRRIGCCDTALVAYMTDLPELSWADRKQLCSVQEDTLGPPNIKNDTRFSMNESLMNESSNLTPACSQL